MTPACRALLSELDPDALAELAEKLRPYLPAPVPAEDHIADALMSVRQAAQHATAHPERLRRAIRAGRLPAVRVAPSGVHAAGKPAGAASSVRAVKVNMFWGSACAPATLNVMTAEIGFELKGTGAVIAVRDPSLLPHVAGALPADAKRRSPARGDRRFELVARGDGDYVVLEEGKQRGRAESLHVALVILSNYLLLHALLRARDALFIHAGAVGYHGSAIVLPGMSGAGKSTLVGALLCAGAEYYTDDYLPLDRCGRVHPFAKPLWLNDEQSGYGVSRSPESFGAVSGTEPIPVGVIAHLHYREGANLRLEPRTAAAGMMLLLGNALGTDLRPDFSVRVARQAAEQALSFEGERGDAEEAAPQLLSLLGGHGARQELRGPSRRGPSPRGGPGPSTG